jgi:hypothetical protein
MHKKRKRFENIVMASNLFVAAVLLVFRLEARSY